MKHILFFTLISFFPLVIVSQNDPKSTELQILHDSQSQSFKTMIIDINNASLNQMGELKDELSTWKEKVTNILIDEKNKKMSITHNGLMNSKEFLEVLEKYQIKKNEIISYN